MLNNSRKLSKGLIIFSALIAEYEKFDFKNDALAGVRANYYNSQFVTQQSKTELYINSDLFYLSYNLEKDKPLAWKVTRNNRPYQTVRLETAGIYCVLFYDESGVIFKRVYFDKEHNWIKTEYYNKFFEGVVTCRFYPKDIDGVFVILEEMFSQNGEKSVEYLYPSLTAPNGHCEALAYTNEGMVWFDKVFKPEGITLEKKPEQTGGFSFSPQSFVEKNEEFFDIELSEYLEDGDSLLNAEPEPVEEKAEDKPYSAYEKIEQILTEAHKSNKNLFGEIIANADAIEPVEQTLEEKDKTNIDNAEESSTVETGEIKATTVKNKINVEAPAGEISKDDNEAVEAEKVTETVEEVSETSTETQDSENIGEASSAENLEYKAENGQTNDKETQAVEPVSPVDTTQQALTPQGDVDDIKSSDDIMSLTAKPIKDGKYYFFGEIDSFGNRMGNGRTVTTEGATLYEGEYYSDNREGFGVCYYKNGKINYVGSWNQNNRTGAGIGYRLSDGTMHAGKWNENKPDGYGARFDKEGNFVDLCNYNNGVRNGKSVSFDENGNVVVAMWNNGKLVSEKIIDTEV